MDATFRQARHLLKVVDEKGLSCEQLDTLHSSGLLTDLFEATGQGRLGVVDRRAFRSLLGLEGLTDVPSSTPEPSVETFTVSIPYAGSKTIARLLKAGEYDWQNEDITDRYFPAGDTSGEEIVEPSLVHFNRTFTNGDEVIRALDEAGFVPALPAHLLALGAAKPDLQRQFPIAALGQVWAVSRGSRCVVALLGDADDRSAGLHWLGRDWGGGWRFLALRK